MVCIFRTALALLLIVTFPTIGLCQTAESGDSKRQSVARSTERQPAPGSRRGMRLSQNEHRMVVAINRYRAERGLAPLRVDPTLMNVARRSAPHFSHVVDGKWCWHRAHQAGFRGWATDNIADGYPTPEDAVQGWATSDGHARQMRGYFKMNGRWCNYRFNRVGVGISGRKYIAVFGLDQSPQTSDATRRPKSEAAALPPTGADRRG